MGSIQVSIRRGIMVRHFSNKLWLLILKDKMLLQQKM